MFISLKLKHFRQHVDAAFDFTKGINAIRGANEAGKTTLIEAISYAMGGANCLRESLEETVTWGQKESALWVELVFQVNDTTVRITRAKSGAELFVGKVLTVTGQKDVTRFVESLIGTSIATMTKMMMANQAALRGALADGPAATVALIESLANFSLIDEIILLVQEKLPTGNTNALEGSIATMSAQLDVPLVDERTGARAVYEEVASKVADAKAQVEAAQLKTANALPAFNEAEALRVAAEDATAAASRAFNDLATAEQRLKTITVPDAPDTSKIPQLEKEIAEVRDAKAIKVHKDLLDALPNGDEWDEGADALEAAVTALRDKIKIIDSNAQGNQQEIETTRREIQGQRQQLQQKQLERTGLQAKLIKETHCAFCDKDLTDVPEVTAFNDKLTPQIEAVDAAIAELESAIAALDATVAAKLTGAEAYKESRAEAVAEAEALEAVQKRARDRATIYQNAAAYITLDQKYVPARWTWTGPDLTKPLNTGAAAALQAIQNAATARQTAQGRFDEASARVLELTEALKRAQADAEAAVEKSGKSEVVRQDYTELVHVFNEANQVYEAATDALKEAQHTLQQAEAVHAERVKSREALQRQLDSARKTLAETHVNNALLKKLRGAKPQVADKLWAMVLASVSRYFSQVRGVPSVVSRSAGGFLVDGQSVGGLSGSTLDALGLAIRIALTKTFLPNSRFMVLDEPAAACDDNRETNMLGLIAASDFDQILLITHSDLCDTFAQQIIQL